MLRQSESTSGSRVALSGGTEHARLRFGLSSRHRDSLGVHTSTEFWTTNPTVVGAANVFKRQETCAI